MSDHNKTLALTLSKQQIINNPNTQYARNEVNALKKVIYKLSTKQDLALHQTMLFNCDESVYQMHMFTVTSLAWFFCGIFVVDIHLLLVYVCK